MVATTRSQILRTIGMLIAVCSVSISAEAKYSGGNGTVHDPYQIAMAEDLMQLGDSPEDYGEHFILAAHIDLDPNLPGRKVFDRAVIAPGTQNADGLFQGTLFAGVFDGNGHTISHLTVAGEDFLGLFGALGPGGHISNLGVEAVDVYGTGDGVGGLVGQNWGIIVSSYSDGKVTGEEYVGGLVGKNQGSIVMCDSAVTVAGSRSVAGLVGQNWNIIVASWSRGEVTGDEYVGGLVGENTHAFGAAGEIVSSYSTCTVLADAHVAGLVGNNNGSVATSYSTGLVMGDADVGGLVGSNQFGVVTSSFWDIENSGQTASAGGTGLTTAKMQEMDMFMSERWDFVDEIFNGTCDYWRISPGDYPRLRYHVGDSPVMPEGSGTSEEPYLIRDARDLGTMWFKPLAHYRLVASVNLSEIMWSLAVVPWFEGTFDGNGHVISDLRIQGGGNLGLFGVLGGGGRVFNLGLEAMDVNGTGRHVGGLAGQANGIIATSFSSGAVSGMSDVGGLVGENNGIFSVSFSSSYVSGISRVGGFVGSNQFGIITKSYSAGPVIGDEDVGGFVGSNQFGVITASFWDIGSSGQATSAGGVGLTTDEMHAIDTFLSEGWDSVDEIFNGTCDYWQMSPGDYPRLRYHTGDSPVMPEGSGTDEKPYLIRDARDLGTMWFRPLANYRLEASVNLSGITWSLAVVPWFEGAFDGNGHVISNLHIQGDRNVGLFGILLSRGRISNLGLEAVDVNGADLFVGGLVGMNFGAIAASYSIGSVSGTSGVGGLAGSNSSDGMITTSYSSGDVSGTSGVGGLVGQNFGGFISTSYSVAVVTGDEGLGGLVGGGDASIGASFWDMESSGQPTSAGGTGLTTAEMQTATTFLEAGWDLGDETANGTEDIWWILEGQDYPRLWWELQ